MIVMAVFVTSALITLGLVVAQPQLWPEVRTTRAE
jgi:hypothetical protein